MNELQGSSFTYLTMEACAWCARNWQFKVDEVASPFHAPEPMNNITSRQVNPPFIRPHSGALLRRFARNHFSLRSMPQFDAWTTVYIPRPPSTFNCRAFPHSGLICNHLSTPPLIFNHQIKRHIINPTRGHGLIHQAPFHSGVIYNRWCNLPVFFHHWIKRHVPDSAKRLGLNHHASLCSGGIPICRCDRLYFSAVGLDGTYPIPPSAWVLTTMQV